MYWKEDGTQVRSHTRRVAKRDYSRSRIDYRARRLTVLIWIGFIICFGGIALNYTESTARVQPVEARDEVPAELPLSGATDFESAEPASRDAVERDGRGGDLFDKYFGSKADEARKVAKCESGNRVVKSKANKNGTYDYGNMQINSLWLKYYGLTEAQILDPETNIATAKKIYDRSGNWSAWKSSAKCHGLK